MRFVSHEIRSPLNVAIAGLEILKADLEAAGVSRAIRNLLEDVSFASNTAIEILNDMLQYEHIDSGSFKLELAVVALDNLFLGRLEAYKFMASNKSIILSIEDHADVSGLPRDIEIGDISSTPHDEIGAVSSVLYIDKFRVEQVLRNLVSNAIKFTPENGRITLRFLRITTFDIALESLHKPIMQLQDESVSKQVHDYLRIAVEDNGAGDVLHCLLSLLLTALLSCAMCPLFCVCFVFVCRHLSRKPGKVVQRVHAIQPQRSAEWRRLWVRSVDLQKPH